MLMWFHFSHCVHFSIEAKWCRGNEVFPSALKVTYLRKWKCKFLVNSTHVYGVVYWIHTFLRSRTFFPGISFSIFHIINKFGCVKSDNLSDIHCWNSKRDINVINVRTFGRINELFIDIVLQWSNGKAIFLNTEKELTSATTFSYQTSDMKMSID